MPKGFPRPRTLLLILAVFVWFGSSVQPRDSGARKQLAANPRALLTNPLLGLAALVDRDGDDRLYYNYAQLMVGETPDLEYLSTKEQGDPRTARARLEAAITPGPGLRLPYRDFPVEYPPVPLALMLLPRLLVASYYPYRMVFGGFIAALFLLTAWLGARLVAAASVPGSPSTEVVWRRLGWLLLAIGPILCQRFDILPAALVAAALAALAHRRDWLAGVAVGLAILTKLYPLLIVFPVAAFLVGAGQWRRVARAAVACTLTMAAVAAPFLITAPEAFLRSNALYGARPFHFESTWGSLLLALRGPATLVSSFGSLNVISPGWLLQLAGLVLAAGLLALAIVAGQRGRALAAASPTEQTAASLAFTFASLLFVLATSKVLSPQFFIWLIPLAALLPGASGRRIYLFALAVAGLTQIFYPPLYGLARKGSPIAVAVLLLRNGLLVALAVTVMRQARRSGVVAPPDHRPTDAPDAPGPAATARA